GARTSADGRGSVAWMRSASGAPKARVLPEPVGARTGTARPARTSAITIRWTANGVSRPRLARAPDVAADRPRPAKVEGGMVLLLAARDRACSGRDSTDPKPRRERRHVRREPR